MNESETAFNDLINSNLRLVVSIAKTYGKRFNTNGSEFLDIIQDGSIGLRKGISGFDPTRGNRLSTYITWWIRQKMANGLMKSRDEIRKPKHVHTRKNIINRAEREIEKTEGGRSLTEYTSLTEEQIRVVKDAKSQKVVSIYEPVWSEDSDLLRELEDTSPSPLENAERSQLTHHVQKALDEANLNPNQRKVLEGRFWRDMTLEELGKEMGYSKEWIRQIESDTLKKLRRFYKPREILIPHWDD